MHYKSHQSAIESNNSFTIKVEDLIREIVIQNDIPYYRIESGVEHHIVEGAEDSYMPVIRIITYFEDTVNKISHILHDEFDVDIERSVDKKKIRIETFAYKNINYTATLKADRQKQTEYKRSGDKKFEIQICSMLQDAWSGIEKELGYDNVVVPDEAKRDFYRVGALLEMADIEFLKIRTELAQKKSNRNTAPVQEVQPQPAPAPAPLPAPAAPVAEEPVVVAEKKVVNTFVEHLQAVAKEVQKEAPAPPPAPVAEFVPPVYEQPKAAPIPVAPVAEFVPPVPEQPKPAPVAEYVPPVQEQPKTVPAPPKAEPKPEPFTMVELPVIAVPQPAPVVAETPVQHVASAPAAQPIAPQRTVAPMGIAPKPTVIPPAETIANGIAASSNINIDNLKELAQSINSVEQKKPVVAEVPPVVKEEPKPAPVAPPPPPVPVAEAPKPAPEVVIPAAKTFTIPSEPVIPPPAPVSNLNVNGNGEIENIAEPVKESVVEKVVPIYNETQKVAKAAQPDENAQMTDVTLREYVMNSKLLKEIDTQIAERAGAKINSDVDIEGDVERLRFLKVYTLKQLHERLMDNKEDIVAFAEKWIGKDNGGSFDSGISLFYLEYLLVGKKNDPAFAVEYVVKFISDNDYSARYIIPTYNSIHNTEAPNFSHLTLKA